MVTALNYKFIKLNIILTLFIVFNSGLVISQEIPPIQDYLPKDYNAENQNWAISQTNDKHIYVANAIGLLEFNGSEWSLYESPNQTIVRSVKAIDNVIYTGAYMDFGYWKKNQFNILQYTSLAKLFEDRLIDDEQFWNIHSLDDGSMVFQSLDRLYIFNQNNQDFKIIESETSIIKSYMLDNVLYFQEYEKGLFKIVDGKRRLVSNDYRISKETIANLFQVNGTLWILTQNDGFYQIDDDGFSESTIASNDLIKNKSIYSALQLRDGSFVLGTISDGIIQLDQSGEILLEINQKKGLLNNTVLSIFEDQQNNVWLGLDNGLNCINMNSAFKLFNDNEGILGSVYASAVYDGKIYLGTNQGLFFKDLNSNDPFQFIKNTEGQVWALFQYENSLFCSHHSGTYIIKGATAEKIVGTLGNWNIRPIYNTNLLLLGNYDGLSVIESKEGVWRVRNKLEGFNFSARHFEMMPSNLIFINHEYKGIFKLKTTDNYEQITKVELDSTYKGANSGITKYQDDLIYSYEDGIYQYSESETGFIKHPFLNELYMPGDYVSGNLTMDSTGDYLWSFSRSNINYIYTDDIKESSKQIKRIPINSDLRGNLVGYENVLHLANDRYLFGGVSGYIVIDLSKFTYNSFDVVIEKISKATNSNYNEPIPLALNNLKPRFNSEENNIAFSYYVPQYQKYLETEYQYQLSGMYNKWSPWSTKSQETFQNLQFGDYEFKVRARIGEKISDNIARFTFTIAKPWYLSNVALALYVIALLLFSLLMHRLYKSYYVRQQQKLVKRKNQEMKLLQSENEGKLIRIQNEHLEQENKIKGRELAASAMSIVKKNEVLTKVKNELNEIEDKKLINPVLKLIDKSINKADDWEFFKQAFDNADKGFLKKVKNIYPNLTPNDLKLCAYLRLNLSSKEIAPLFNISSRSVEIKRYRLRKKMDLSHDVNLVNHILEL